MSTYKFDITSDELPAFKTFLEYSIYSLEQWSNSLESELEFPHTDDKYSTVMTELSTFQHEKLILQSVLEQIERALD